MPKWVFNYLNGTVNPIDDIFGYWTSNADSSDISRGYLVDNYGGINSNYVSDIYNAGIRPVIEISKENIK